MILSINGIIAGKGVAPITDADVLAFITAASITDSTQKSAINQLVLDLKTANIWIKMKAIYPFVGGTASQHRYNLKDPRPVAGAFYLDFYGGGTHSANGYQPDGATAYADTKFIPLNNATDNNTHLSYYSRTNNTTSGVDIGAFNPGSNYFLQLWTTVNGGISRSSVQRNDTDFSSFVSTTRQGHFIGQVGLSGFNSFSKIYQNGVLKNTNNVNNTVVRSNVAVYIGALNINGAAGAYVNRESAFASIGDGLSDSEATAFYNAVQNFNTTLNRQV